MALSWKLMDLIYRKAENLKPRSKREKTFLGTIRYILVEHAALKMRHQKLLKKRKENR